MKKSLKIAMIEHIGGHGGNEFYDLGLCEALSLQHKVFWFTCDETVIDQKVNIKTKVIKCYRGIFKKNNKLVRGVKYLLGTIYSLLYCLKEEVDIIHLHYYGFNIIEKLNLKLFKMFRFKIIATVHDIEPFDKKKENLDIDYNSFLKPLDAIIVHTNFSKKILSKIINKEDYSKIYRIQSGDIDFLYNVKITKEKAREALGLPIDKKIILFFGHIKRVKGLDLLISAFNKVALEISDVFLVVAGRPWKIDMKEYYSLVDNRIRDKVLFQLNYIPNEQVNLYFKSSDIVVLPYKKIYNSSVILRAFDYGSCVLASNLESLKEFIIPGVTGEIFAKGDKKELAEKIIILLNSSKTIERIKLNSKDFIDKNFSKKEILTSMNSVYNFVLEE